MKRRKARNVYQCGFCKEDFVNKVGDDIFAKCPHCYNYLNDGNRYPKIIGHQEYHPSHVWYIPTTWFSGVWVHYPQVVVLK